MIDDVEEGEVCTVSNNQQQQKHTTPVTSTMMFRYTPQTMPSVTRSLFPPFPHSTPVSNTAFSVVTTNMTASSNMNIYNASTALTLFEHTIHQHIKQDTVTTDITARHQHQQQSTDIISTQDIKRVYISRSKRNIQQHIFYIHCVTTDAYHRLRHIVATQTTLVPINTYDRYITGRVHAIPHHVTTLHLEQHIHHHAPQITTLSITRSLQSYPSTHFRDHAYFSIRADQIQYLALIPALPGFPLPMTWERFIPPAVSMCSLCFSRTHKRHSCPHLEAYRTSRIICCANCGEPGHVARACHKHIRCLCCDSNLHNVLECASYKPSYRTLSLPLSPSTFPHLPRIPSHISLSSSIPFTSSPTPSTSSSLHSNTSLSSHTSRTSDTSNTAKKRRVALNTDDIRSYDERPNHSPLSPSLQRHLDRSSLTRASSTSPISSRSPTPSPTPSETKIAQLELQRLEDQQTIATLQQQVAALMAQMKHMSSHVQTQTSQTMSQSATTPVSTVMRQSQQMIPTQATTSATTMSDTHD